MVEYYNLKLKKKSLLKYLSKGQGHRGQNTQGGISSVMGRIG